MEDTVWMWPHRNDQIKKNIDHFKMFKQIIELMGREIISPAEFREKLGIEKTWRQAEGRMITDRAPEVRRLSSCLSGQTKKQKKEREKALFCHWTQSPGAPSWES